MDHHHKKKRINEIERQLLPRLKLVGLVIVFFCAVSFGYAVISDDYTPPPADQMLTPDEKAHSSGLFGPIKSPFLYLTDSERMKCFIMSGVFAAISGLCFLYAKKKKREFESDQF